MLAKLSQSLSFYLPNPLVCYLHLICYLAQCFRITKQPEVPFQNFSLPWREHIEQVHRLLRRLFMAYQIKRVAVFFVQKSKNLLRRNVAL